MPIWGKTALSPRLEVGKRRSPKASVPGPGGAALRAAPAVAPKSSSWREPVFPVRSAPRVRQQ
eukprot:13742395-Alexandrium_andersonii.AAC.1